MYNIILTIIKAVGISRGKYIPLSRYDFHRLPFTRSLLYVVVFEKYYERIVSPDMQTINLKHSESHNLGTGLTLYQ
jgi:hypothetical protein